MPPELPPQLESASGLIRVRGARMHNLKNLDLDIPRGKLVVLTGVSGSGKSSLAFDTLFAEGQRRYVQSLSAYARQFLDQFDKPEVDFIDGLSPAVAIEQCVSAPNPRSTIATTTEIYDDLRVLYATAGQPHDPQTGVPLKKMTSVQIADEVLSLPEGTRLMILAPVLRHERADIPGLFEKLQRQGFVRARIDGVIHELDEKVKPAKKKPDSIEIVIDRLGVREGVRGRLMEALETALKWNPREVRTLAGDGETAELRSFTTCYTNTATGAVLDDFTPKHFSFNTHLGACPVCEGVGTVMACDPGLLVPDVEKSIKDGAIKGWWNKQPKLKVLHERSIESLARFFEADLSAPFQSLPDAFKRALFHGTGEVAVPTGWKIGSNKRSLEKPFEGLVPMVERMFARAKGASLKAQLARYLNPLLCKACGGRRLKPEVLGVRLKSEVGSGRSEVGIHQFAALSVRDAVAWMHGIVLTELQKTFCTELQREILKRLEFLERVGLGYLTLDRESGTLSGGEAQRIRLAAQIGSGLAGVLYVLDEPSIGLHPADNARLISTLFYLRDLGNSVLVVEHDEDTMRAADWLVELGPGAGPNGGRLVAQGIPDDVIRNQHSITGDFLSGRRQIPVPQIRIGPRAQQAELIAAAVTGKAKPQNPKFNKEAESAWLTVHGASEHNLKNVTVAFPLGCFIGVTGASGSGKSSLVDTILCRALMRHFYGAKDEPGKHERISGLHSIDKVVVIDQSSIGRSPRSNPATYTGAFTPIRELFAKLPAARVRGYGASRFSFNVPGGRCEKCSGDGLLTIDMHFLNDVQVTCDQCGGRRYNSETLEITFKGRNIADVLDLTVSEACQFFDRQPQVLPKLKALNDVGLGYVKLGQSGAALSGGEAQRVKLAAELAKRATGRTLYLLDEPTIGLHFADIEMLLAVLMRLRDAGNTLVVVEHNLDVIKCADWIIDLGPGGGEEGGEVVAEGTPEQIAANDRSSTGSFLRQLLMRPMVTV
ncbi:MAG: excinuclease ABC subunit UvrA [Verrucomicrobia bacterium]|nr:excinuclease ABC subunit UvrA [Verrucomicrobiota bacterium]